MTCSNIFHPFDLQKIDRKNRLNYYYHFYYNLHNLSNIFHICSSFSFSNFSCRPKKKMRKKEDEMRLKMNGDIFFVSMGRSITNGIIFFVPHSVGICTCSLRLLPLLNRRSIQSHFILSFSFLVAHQRQRENMEIQLLNSHFWLDFLTFSLSPDIINANRN